jgi:hypothetical protein
MVQPTPSLGSPAVGFLLGVSCSSANACTAVGLTTASASLAEAWDGTNWTIESTPDLPNGSELVSVSCRALNACIAVGGDGLSTLAEGWDGAKWTVEPTSQLEGGLLEGVSCASTTVCAAVGTYASSATNGNVTLAERWNGTTWQVQPTANPVTPSFLQGVSCTSALSCTAVGGDGSYGSGQSTLAERWNGSSWQTESTAVLPTGTDAGLESVSCSSAVACTAVGDGVDESAFQCNWSPSSFAEIWDGGNWAMQNMDGPLTPVSSDLAAVSCSSRTWCAAVGEFSAKPNSLALAETWNGARWQIQPIAPTVNSDLTGVSCSSATARLAVDRSGKTLPVPLAEVWDGTAWTARAVPLPAGDVGGSLQGVSCVSPSACTAVGSAVPRTGPSVAWAERWDDLGGAVHTPGGHSRVERPTRRVPPVSSCVHRRRLCHPDLNSQPLAEAWDGTSWVVLLLNGVHGRRLYQLVVDRPRLDQRSAPGGVVERHNLEDPKHPEPRRQPVAGRVLHIGGRLHRRWLDCHQHGTPDDTGRIVGRDVLDDQPHTRPCRPGSHGQQPPARRVMPRRPDMHRYRGRHPPARRPREDAGRDHESLIEEDERAPRRSEGV